MDVRLQVQVHRDELMPIPEATPDTAPSHVAPWRLGRGAADPAPAVLHSALLAIPPTEQPQQKAIKKQAWTPEEDAKLLAMVQTHGPSAWSQIALHLPGRVGKQCRERWHNHLSPEVKKENFTEEEDRLIMEAVAEHGTKWAHIVKLIPGRTDNAIKNRWNSATRKLVRMQKRSDKNQPGAAEPAEDVSGSSIDMSTMGAAELARHLLATGLNPREARVKRKAPANLERAPKASKVSKEPTLTQAVGGLDLLSSLAATDDERLTSPAGFRAAMSLVQSLSSGKMPKRPRAARSLLVDAKKYKDRSSSARRMEAAVCLGSFAIGSEAAATPAAMGVAAPACAIAGSLGMLSAVAAM